MLKYALTLCVLIPIILAQSQESSSSSSEEDSINSGSHTLFKIFPRGSRQVEFLKKYALAGQSAGRAIIITPLGDVKVAYVLVPISSNGIFQEMMRREHIKSKLIEVTTIKSVSVDNSMHMPSEFPPSHNNRYNSNPNFRLQLRDPYPEDHVIQSPRITTRGTWGSWASCVPNAYVVGFSLKTQKDAQFDNSAVNGIKLQCAPYGALSNIGQVIQSLEGDFGQWGGNFTCPSDSYAEGFELRSEDDQGADDDSGANNLKLVCSDRQKTVITGDGLSFGAWTGRQSCLKNQGICGLRVQVEQRAGTADQTGLNNVDMDCCNLPAAP